MLRLLINRPLLNTDGGGSAGASGSGGAAGGEGGGAGASGTPGTGGAAGGAPEGGAGTGNPWFSGFKAEDVRGYIETKGFKDPESLASAYWNLEKTRGVPADRLLTLPGDDKPESMAPIYDKLGRPAKPELYELPTAEGVPAEFAKWQADTFHKLGLSKKQAQSLSTEWNGLLANSKQAEAAQFKEARATQIASLKQEWGQAAGAMGDKVDAMQKAIGLDDKQVESIERAIGFDGFAKLMIGIQEKFGIKLEESSFHTGTGTGNDFGGMTPAAAGQRRQELLSNSDYRKAWESGDQAKVKEIDRLFQIQYQNG